MQLTLCRVEAGGATAGDVNRCAAVLKSIEEQLRAAPDFDVVEQSYDIHFGRPSLSAWTGLGSTDSDVLKRTLRSTGDYWDTLTSGPFGRFGHLATAYNEQGPTNGPSHILFGMDVELSARLKNRIEHLWEDRSRNRNELLQIRNFSCTGGEE